MEQWWVYILKWNTLYVGHTGNLEKRLLEHQKGTTITTSKIWAFELARRIPCASKQEAIQLEKKIKKWGHYERRI
jgi:predicted GIY-YIG superfamily endonuclease